MCKTSGGCVDSRRRHLRHHGQVPAYGGACRFGSCRTPDPEPTTSDSPTASPSATATRPPPDRHSDADADRHHARTHRLNLDRRHRRHRHGRHRRGSPVSIGSSDVAWAAHLGDMAYQSGAGIEQQWCDYVKARVSQPFQLVPGNHEAQNGDGLFANYAACLPDRLNVNGTYERGQWWVDSGRSGTSASHRTSRYRPGIASTPLGRRSGRGSTASSSNGKAAGQWVIVGMHIPCLTVGIHGGCERDQDPRRRPHPRGVDLVVQGHDHNYPARTRSPNWPRSSTRTMRMPLARARCSRSSATEAKAS